MDHSPVHINRESQTFLVLHMTEDLSRPLKTTCQAKKNQQHLHFICRQKRAKVPPLIFTTFYRGTVVVTTPEKNDLTLSIYHSHPEQLPPHLRSHQHRRTSPHTPLRDFSPSCHLAQGNRASVPPPADNFFLEAIRLHNTLLPPDTHLG